MRELRRGNWLGGHGFASFQRARVCDEASRLSTDGCSADGRMRNGLPSPRSRGWETKEEGYFVSRLATQSRVTGWSLRVISDLPLMVSSLTFPEYLIVMVFPLNSRVTVNATASPLMVPSEMAVSLVWPLRPGEVTVPVSFSPSTFRTSLLVRSGPPLRPGTVHIQVPEGSAFPWAWVEGASSSAIIAQVIADRRPIKGLRCIDTFIWLFQSIPFAIHPENASAGISEWLIIIHTTRDFAQRLRPTGRGCSGNSAGRRRYRGDR